MGKKSVRGKKKVKKKVASKRMPRPHRIAVTFNKKEYEMVLHYIDKHNIENKSKFVREVVLNHLWKKTGEQHPRLFDDVETL